MKQEPYKAESINNIIVKLEKICSEENHSFRSKFIKLRSVYRDILSLELENEIQLFSSTQNKLYYIADKRKLDKDLIDEIKLIASNFSILIRKKEYSISYDDFIFGAKALNNLNFALFDKKSEIIDKIAIDYHNLKLALRKIEISEQIDFIQAIVIGKVESEKSIKCNSDLLGDFEFYHSDLLPEFYSACYLSAKINIIKGFIKSGETHKIYASKDTLTVIEPDILIDVTELAECFNNGAKNHLIYFLKRFFVSEPTINLLVGSAANSCLDSLMLNPDIDFEDILSESLAQKPLSTLVAMKKDAELIEKVEECAIEHYNNLKDLAPTFKNSLYSLEASFISPKYGLQGRLDLLLEFENDKYRKTIIELKSGSSPNRDYSIEIDGKRVIAGLWHNHLAQATGYNLLLDSAFPNRSGDSQILYSKERAFPLRNAPNIQLFKKELLELRNTIISAERSLCLTKFAMFDNLIKENQSNFPKFSQKDFASFCYNFKKFNNIERNYFLHFFAFALRENWSGKAGFWRNNNDMGHSRLWRETQTEKEDLDYYLSNLKLINEETDFEKLYLAFEIDLDFDSKGFREGDFIILYKSGEEQNPTNQQILKGSIRKLENERLIISIRNKALNRSIFDDSSEWALELDYISSGFSSLSSSLYSFISGNSRVKNLVFGLAKPEFDEHFYYNKTLSKLQNEIISKALGAKDYFLIQGPPGSGKTSYILKNIVESIYRETNENILLVAYTNRATDEIVATIKRINPKIDLIRLGSKDSSEHDDVSLAYMAEETQFKELSKKVEECRIFVSTASSIVINKELFSLKKFDTLIIDEASQILEYQIVGALAEVNKFIMIGDEKQLPAVCSQSKQFVRPKKLDLESIYLYDLSESLFERLLRISKIKNYGAIGFLENQGRMHSEIQEFPSKYFYGGNLKILEKNEKQICEDSLFCNSEIVLDKILSKSRVIFINTPKSKRIKKNSLEAKIAAIIAKRIQINLEDSFKSASIGIIAPFRAQCSEIRSNLDYELKRMITVDTVERFQGSERDAIIYSFCANSLAALNKIQELIQIEEELIDRKLNVALTRAKERLILLGNSEILSQNETYKKLIEYVKSKDVFYESDYFSEFEEIEINNI